MTSPKKLGSSSIQVIVRLRPMNEKEKKSGTLPVVTASTSDRSVTVIKGQGARQVRSTFSFDRVFTAFSSQQEVFDESISSVIGDVLKGYESTVFAYGQTGTGKTHTMEGDLESQEMQGVIPRSATAIFEQLRLKHYTEHTVTCSYLEIYNEDLCDLLVETAGEKKKLEIMEGKQGTFCRGLTKKEVRNAGDVLALMHKSQQQRRIGETKMNKQSSRSHCIFTMAINAKVGLKENSEIEFSGKLHMVDLAGSECAKTAGMDSGGHVHVEAARERERMNINRSLLTLGRVISLLKEQSESKKNNSIRIPYRDSKLTRILQESLGGRCKTVVIATLSPAVSAIEESLSTLNYAQSANGIVNKPVATSYMSISSSGARSHSSKAAVSDAGDGGNSVQYWQEMECRLQYMQGQVEEAQAALARKHMQQQDLVDRVERAESEKLIAEKQVFEVSARAKRAEEEVEAERARRKDVERKLCEAERALRETSAVLEATRLTENHLTQEATALLDALKTSIRNTDALQAELSRGRETEIEKRAAALEFHAASSSLLERTVSSIARASANSQQNLSDVSDSIEEVRNQEKRFSREISKLLAQATREIQELSRSTVALVRDDRGILQTVASMSTAAYKRLDAIAKSATRSRDALDAFCQTECKALNTHVSCLAEIQTSNEELAEESRQRLQANVETSNQEIAANVANMTKTLSEGASARERVRGSLEETLSKWATDSTDRAEEIGTAAAREKETLGLALKTFTENARHLETVETVLETQNQFFHDTCKPHLESLDEHASSVTQHSQLLAKTYQQEKDVIQKAFAHDFMNGIKELMNKQMLAVSRHMDQKYDAIRGGNADLEKQTTQLQSAAKIILKTSRQTNRSISDETSSAKQNDGTFAAAMDLTRDKLDLLAAKSDLQKEGVSIRTAEASHHLEQFSALDSSLPQAIATYRARGERCSNKLRDVLLENAASDIRSLSALAKESADYARDSISAHVANLSSLPNPDDAAALLADAKGTCAVVSSATNEVRRLGEILAEGTRSASSSLAASLSRDGRADNRAVLEKHLGVAADSVAAIRADAEFPAAAQSAEEASEEARRFVFRDLRAEEPVPAVEGPPAVAYRERLSATPPEEVLLRPLRDVVEKENVRDDISVASSICSLPASPLPLQERTNKLERSSGVRKKQRKPSVDRKRCERIPTTPLGGRSTSKRSRIRSRSPARAAAKSRGNRK